MSESKVWTFIYRCLQGSWSSNGLQPEMAYWPALAVGSTAQLAATHCPNERTLDLGLELGLGVRYMPISPIVRCNNLLSSISF